MISPVKVWRNQGYVRALLGRRGTVVSYSVVRVPPTGFADQAPYPVAVVELEDGYRGVFQLVDWCPDDLTIGRPVVLVVRKIMQPNTDGIIPYGIKAKPA